MSDRTFIILSAAILGITFVALGAASEMSGLNRVYAIAFFIPGLGSCSAAYLVWVLCRRADKRMMRVDGNRLSKWQS